MERAVVVQGSGRKYVMKEMTTGTWDLKEKDQSMNEVPLQI
jgi:hypothetical protein